MFEEMIQQVLGFSKTFGDVDDIDDKLLASPCLNYSIKDEIVTSVSKVTDQQ